MIIKHFPDINTLHLIIHCSQRSRGTCTMCSVRGSSLSSRPDPCGQRRGGSTARLHLSRCSAPASGMGGIEPWTCVQAAPIWQPKPCQPGQRFHERSTGVVYTAPGWGCSSASARGMVCVWGGQDSGGTDNSIWVLARDGKRVGLGKAFSPGRDRTGCPARAHHRPQPCRYSSDTAPQWRNGGSGWSRSPRVPWSESSKASALTHRALLPGAT